MTEILDIFKVIFDLFVISLWLLSYKVVSVEYESSSSRPEFNYKKQTPFIYSTLTRKLYLEDKTHEKE